MKKSLQSLLIFFFALLNFLITNAQTPCAGMPGGNTVIPVSQTICAGQAINLTLANNYSTTGITYQWQTSTVSPVGPFTSIPGATLHSYNTPTLSNAQGNVLFFNVVITCTNGNLSVSIPYSITIVNCNTPCSGTPAATGILPANPTVCIGNSAALSLSTTYTNSGMTYQWSSSPVSGGPFTPVTGATLSSYVTPTLTSTTYYQVIITCTNTNATYIASQTVTAMSCTFCSGPPPSNTIMPSTQTVCAGTSLTLSLANSYTASGFTYQWQQSTVSQVGPFSPINGATSTTYATGPINTTTFYNLVITCTNSSQSTSIVKSVNVVNCNVPCAGTPGSNTILPVSSTICIGNTQTLTLANAYQSSGINYQWGNAASVGGPYTAIPGATSSSYITTPLNANGYYNVIITCTNGAMTFVTTQSVAVVACTACAGAPPANTMVPTSPTICSGTPINLSLLNTYTSTGYTYQWQQSTVSNVGPYQIIPSATNSTYASPPLFQTTYFNVVVTCTNGGQSTQVVNAVNVITCNACSGAPAQTSILPANYTLCTGNSGYLSLSTNYTQTGITYQWGAASSAAGPYTAVPGATFSTFNTPTLSANAFYNVVITCVNSGQTTTATQSIAILPCNGCNGAPPANTILPASSTLCVGSNTALTLANSYTATGFTYQWFASTLSTSGFTPVTGATSTILVTPNLSLTTYYNLVITCSNSGSSTTLSSTVVVIICGGGGGTACATAPASNTIVPVTQSVCIGSTANMSLMNTYTASGITYQWQNSSLPTGPYASIAGATLTSYTSPSLTATSYYQVVITCTNGNLSTSIPHTVTVNNCGVGIEKNKGDQSVSVYPNPNSGLFTISSGSKEALTVVIYDVMGKKVLETEIKKGDSEIDIRHLPNGVYSLVIRGAETNKTVKVFKE